MDKEKINEKAYEKIELSVSDLEQVVGGVDGINPEQTTVVSDGKGTNINLKNPVK